MEAVKYEIGYYTTRNGKIPLNEWFLDLKDGRAEAIVRKRIDRISRGNFGDCKLLGDGLFELRVHFGPGYRIYFGKHKMLYILLLCGGDKRMQRWDIMRAKHYWADYQEREK